MLQCKNISFEAYTLLVSSCGNQKKKRITSLSDKLSNLDKKNQLLSKVCKYFFNKIYSAFADTLPPTLPIYHKFLALKEIAKVPI